MGVMGAVGREDCAKKRNASSDGFIHSVPVPSLYREASKILLRYEKKEGTLKKLVFENKRYKDFRRLYATVCKAVDNAEIIQDAFSRIKLFEREPRFNPQMAQVLAGELLYANKELSGECLPVVTILKYKQELQSAVATVGTTKKKKGKVTEREGNPRYVRVNTLLTSAEKVHAELVNEGWKQVTYDGELVSYMEFLKLIKKLDGQNYMCDYHVPDLLIFPHNTPFWSSWLYNKNYIILQDKASCLPVMLADIPAEAEIIDACAAPGNKTSHLAARLGNGGKIYAVEMDKKRFQTLTKLLHQRGVTNVECLNEDFTRLKKENYENISHIFLDPSCSSTGMNIHHDELTSERLKKLSSFQACLLNFALSFPNVKTVIYSTCSIHEEENEEVVSEALEKFGDQFKLENLGEKLKGWKHVGGKKYPFGHLCLKTKFSIDKCHGFFVAKFVRKDECKVEKDESWKKDMEKKGMNRVFNGVEEEITGEKTNEMTGEHNGRECKATVFAPVENLKKKKKKKERKLEADVAHHEASTSGMSIPGTELAKETQAEVENQMETLDYVEECSERARPKKKRKKIEAKIEPLNTVEAGSEEPDVCDNGEGATAEDEVQSLIRKKKKKRKSEGNVITHSPSTLPISNFDTECTEYSSAKGMKGTEIMSVSEGHEEPKVKRKKSRADIDSSDTVEITGDSIGLANVDEMVSTVPAFVEGSVDTNKKTEKKRKKSRADILSSDPVEINGDSAGLADVEERVSTVPVFEEGSVSKKKKKRKKSRADTDSSDPVEITGDNERLADVEEMVSTVPALDEGSVGKKKKKRKKSRADIDSSDPVEINGDNVGLAGVEEMVSTVPVFDEGSVVKKKKKSKKPRTAIDSSDPVEITGDNEGLANVEEMVSTVPVFDEGSVGKKKKKRKKSRTDIDSSDPVEINGESVGLAGVEEMVSTVPVFDEGSVGTKKKKKRRLEDSVLSS